MNERVGVGGIGFHRPARAWPVAVQPGAIVLPAVPTARQGTAGGRWQMLLPVMGSLAMVGFAFVVRSLLYLIVIGLMVVSMVGATLGAQLAGNREERRRWARSNARYLGLVDDAAASAQHAAEVQLAGLNGLYPGPVELFELVRTGEGIWERRRADPDFGWVRLGLGNVRSARPVTLGEAAAAGTEPDPELASAVGTLVTASAHIPGAPLTAALPGLGVLAVVAPGREAASRARGMVASWLASLAVFHAPGDLRIAGHFPEEEVGRWDWLKWLPHCRPLQGGEGFGRARRSVTADPSVFAEVVSDVVRSRLEQTRHLMAAQAVPSPDRSAPDRDGSAPFGQAGWEHIVMFVDGWSPERSSPALDTLMAQARRAAVSFVVLVPSPDQVPSVSGATASFADDGTLLYVESGPGGRVEARVQPDCLGAELALQISRRLAPLRLGWEGSSAAVADSVRLCELLGAEEPSQVPGASIRLGVRDMAGAGSQVRDLLRVPIGSDETGNPVDLDLKEPAAGGMGPHGIMVGATGSGKSELLRSITAALAARHQPSLLNLLLIDYKGGAAFAGLGPLPHVAGLVTNLAEEPGLTGRVKVALAGELERRQRLLRDAGELSSIGEYHAHLARLGNAGQVGAVDAFPYLVVIVDEFGELLEAEPSFIEVFNAIGRMGRSLGVHLLLATQRLDEGRVRVLEPHLRYRLALRTFSAAESRNVLGSPAAFELPPVPGLGYLAVDESLTRFKGAIATLVNRPVGRQPSPLATNALRPLALLGRGSGGGGHRDELPGGTGEGSTVPAGRVRSGQVPVGRALASGAPIQAPETELQALVQVLTGLPGSRARPIWLPPLPAALTLGGLEASAPQRRSLPLLGLVDLPRAQRQEPLVWDPRRAGGNLGVAGAPQTGKSTLLVSLVLALVKRLGPDEAQFYCIDLGGGRLFDLDGLAHVGAVVGPGDAEAAARLLQDMRSLVAERASRRRTGAAAAAGGTAGAVGTVAGTVGSVGTVAGPVASAAGAVVTTAGGAAGAVGTAAGGTAGAVGTVAAAVAVGAAAAASRTVRSGGDGSAEPDVFVVVDNVAMLRQAMPELEAELSALAITGLHHRVHVVVSANRWFDIRPQLLDALGTKLELRLGDPAETLTKREAAKSLPVDRPGRGLTRDGELFQAALPSWLPGPGPDGEVVAIAEAVAEANANANALAARGVVRAPRVTTLPESLTEWDVDSMALDAGSRPSDPQAGFLLGASEFRCRPVQVDLLAPGAHLAVYGDAGSGRTTVLARALGDTLSRLGPDVLTVHLVDPARGLIDFGEGAHVASYVTSASRAEKLAGELAAELALRLPPEGASVAELRTTRWDGPSVLLVVDDYDMLLGAMGSPLAPLADVVAQASAVGLHIICARRVAGSQRTSFEPFSQRLRELRPTTLVLSGSPEEGFVAGGVKARQMPPGRGWLVNRAGAAQLVQCCLPGVPSLSGPAGLPGVAGAPAHPSVSADDGPGGLLLRAVPAGPAGRGGRGEHEIDSNRRWS